VTFRPWRPRLRARSLPAPRPPGRKGCEEPRTGKRNRMRRSAERKERQSTEPPPPTATRAWTQSVSGQRASRLRSLGELHQHLRVELVTAAEADGVVRHLQLTQTCFLLFDNFSAGE